jgi:hypothetical protein
VSGESHESHVTAETLDFDAVAKVANRVKLRDVRLLWSTVGRFAEMDDIDPEWGDAAFMGFDSHSEDMEQEGEEATFAVHCSFICRTNGDVSELSSEAAASDSDEPPDVNIQAVFELVYVLSDAEGIERSDLEQFAFVNGTHNAWPYWREFAHASTLRLGVPPYVVPPFKLPSVHDPEAKAQSEESGTTFRSDDL